MEIKQDSEDEPSKGWKVDEMLRGHHKEIVQEFSPFWLLTSYLSSPTVMRKSEVCGIISDEYPRCTRIIKLTTGEIYQCSNLCNQIKPLASFRGISTYKCKECLDKIKNNKCMKIKSKRELCKSQKKISYQCCGIAVLIYEDLPGHFCRKCIKSSDFLDQQVLDYIKNKGITLYEATAGMFEDGSGIKGCEE